MELSEAVMWCVHGLNSVYACDALVLGEYLLAGLQHALGIRPNLGSAGTTEAHLRALDAMDCDQAIHRIRSQGLR